MLAYSTLSQLGYMFLALGSGLRPTATLVTFAVVAAMFHLFTHAFFKALLFLGAGSVMHAMGNVIDMRRFSGLRQGAADHALDLPVRRRGAGRLPAVVRLLEQGRDPGDRLLGRRVSHPITARLSASCSSPACSPPP